MLDIVFCLFSLAGGSKKLDLVGFAFNLGNDNTRYLYQRNSRKKKINVFSSFCCHYKCPGNFLLPKYLLENHSDDLGVFQVLLFTSLFSIYDLFFL